MGKKGSNPPELSGLPKFIWRNGKIIPHNEALISPMTHALNYATGVIEGIRGYVAYDNPGQMYVFRLKEHFERFLDGCRFMFFPVDFSADQLCQAVIQLIRALDYHQNVYIRPLAYISLPEIGVGPKEIVINVDILITPFGSYHGTGEEGLRVRIDSHKKSRAQLPHGAKLVAHYPFGYRAKTLAKLGDYHEALFFTEDGVVAEATGANIFVLRRDDTILTPPPTDCILEGITRATVIFFIKELLPGLRLEVRSIEESELFAAKEVFLCGTAYEVTHVQSIDRHLINDGKCGPATKRLQGVYKNAVCGRPVLPPNTNHALAVNCTAARWLTKVYD